MKRAWHHLSLDGHDDNFGDVFRGTLKMLEHFPVLKSYNVDGFVGWETRMIFFSNLMKYLQFSFIPECSLCESVDFGVADLTDIQRYTSISDLWILTADMLFKNLFVDRFIHLLTKTDEDQQ